ncbi:MAG: YraN family protein [Spirochaeta sp.]|nr:YraN family protein [Spirochaeta sp.]
MNTVDKGRFGEQCAAKYLQAAGYIIVEKNFRTRWGEVDIISTRENLIAFVEVKTWRGVDPQELYRVFTPAKRRRMMVCAEVYLDRHKEYSGYTIRFDLMYLRPDGSLVEFYENVLT